MITNAGQAMVNEALAEMLKLTPVELVPLVSPNAVIAGMTGELVRLPLAVPEIVYAEITRPGSGLLRRPVEWADLNDVDGGRAFGGTWQVDDAGELPVQVHAVGVVAVTPRGTGYVRDRRRRRGVVRGRLRVPIRAAVADRRRVRRPPGRGYGCGRRVTARPPELRAE